MLTGLLTSFARRVPVLVTVEDLGRPRRWNVDEILASVENKVSHLESLESSSPAHLDKRGLYAWYVDAHGQDVLREAGLYVRCDGLAYVGMTTKQNFKRRLEQHIDRKRARKLKDLRGVLTCVLDEQSSSDGVEELLRHFTVAMTPVRFACEERVPRAERRIIKEAEPCLNREYVSSKSPNLKRLNKLKERAKVRFDDGDPPVDEQPPSSPPSLLDRGFRGLRQVLALLPSASTILGGRRSVRSAAPPEDDGNQAHDTERPRRLTEMGRFRRDFWAHVSSSTQHPGTEAPPEWASSNVRPPRARTDRAGADAVETTGRPFSLYVAQDGVGVFFPRNRGESPRQRAAAVKATVKWLRKKTGNTEMPDNGWSFLELDSRAKRNWDRMADWLHVHRLLFERALRETDR